MSPSVAPPTVTATNEATAAEFRWSATPWVWLGAGAVVGAAIAGLVIWLVGRPADETQASAADVHSANTPPPAESPSKPSERPAEGPPPPTTPVSKPAPNLPRPPVSREQSKAPADPPLIVPIPPVEQPRAETPPAKPTDKPPAPADAPPLEPIVPAPKEPIAEPPPERPPLRTIDLEARLADKLSRIDVVDKPLPQFVELMSSLSTISISLDADALLDAGLALNAPVTVTLTNATVQRALQQGLASARMKYEVFEDQLVVAPWIEDSESMTVVRIAVPELLVNDPARDRDLIEVITRVVAPESWHVGGGAGQGELRIEGSELVIRQTAIGQRQTRRFLEQLRAARRLGSKTVVADDSPLRPRNTLADAALAQTLTLNYGIPTPLDKIVRRLRRETKLNVLVDWRALAQVRIGPETLTTFTSNDQPLSAALASFAAPLQLAVRTLDARSIEITTPAALEERLQVEVYPVGDIAPTAAAAEKLEREFQAVLAARRAQPADTPAAGDQFLYDAASRALVVYHHATAHAALQALLAKHRGSKP